MFQERKITDDIQKDKNHNAFIFIMLNTGKQWCKKITIVNLELYT